VLLQVEQYRGLELHIILILGVTQEVSLSSMLWAVGRTALSRKTAPKPVNCFRPARGSEFLSQQAVVVRRLAGIRQRSPGDDGEQGRQRGKRAAPTER
jgi:hypothetical protein